MSNPVSARIATATLAAQDLSDGVVAPSQVEAVKSSCAVENANSGVVVDGVLAKRGLKEVETTSVAPPEEEVAANKKNKKTKTKWASKKTKTNNGTLGSARGIETMFRSAYRTQLDLTALAATKANIMISLNGLILSVLTLSGPFVLVAEPILTIPIAIFLATCLISIIFAVLAAQPHRPKCTPRLDCFNNDLANVLVFEEFSTLSESQHLAAMLELMQDNTRIYKNMTRQIYMLGTMANRHFRMLRISYTTFLAGLTLSTLLLLGIGLIY